MKCLYFYEAHAARMGRLNSGNAFKYLASMHLVVRELTCRVPQTLALDHNGWTWGLRASNEWGTAMALEDVVSEMQGQADKLKELNHTVLFDLGEEGKILLDATGDEVKITPNPDCDDAETTLVLSEDNMMKLVNGNLNPMVAFTLGKLKVFGSKGIALKLSGLLDK
jgi:putative sterol carrier protein